MTEMYKSGLLIHISLLGIFGLESVLSPKNQTRKTAKIHKDNKSSSIIFVTNCCYFLCIYIVHQNICSSDNHTHINFELIY